MTSRWFRRRTIVAAACTLLSFSMTLAKTHTCYPSIDAPGSSTNAPGAATHEFDPQAQQGGGTIKIENIPEDLALPLPAGVNKILLVTISDAKPRSVWLAKEKASLLRAMLTETSSGKYEINLATQGLLSLLDTKDNAGQFRIFAETADGKILESVAVNFRLGRNNAKPTLLIKSKSTGKRSPVDARLTHWLKPADLDQFEVRADQAQGSAVTAKLGEKTFNFAYSQASRTYILAADPKFLNAWKEQPNLTIMLERDELPALSWELKSIPEKLAYSGYGPTFSVKQRTCEPIPGTNDYLRLQLDDITADQVILTVTNMDEKTIIANTSVKAGDELTLQIGKNNYTLTVHRLVNILIGDNDFGVFSVSDMTQSERRKIDKLIAALESSNLRFLRDGKEYSGREAAEHMRTKLKFAGDSIKTVEDFLIQIASKSSRNGTPYLIKLGDNQTIPAETWLRQKLSDPSPNTPPTPKR